MTWIIRGADANTGEDVELTVDADSVVDAEEYARSVGMLPSSTQQVDDALTKLAQSIGPGKRRAPRYDGILKGAQQLKNEAKSLRDSARSLYLVATVLAVLFVLIVVYRYVSTGDADVLVGLLGAVFLPLPFIVLGKFCIYRATMTLLAAELALAQRDVAINSFQ